MATGRDPRFKAALRARAGRLYRDGKDVEEVAKALGVSKGRAYILIRESGVALRPRGPK